MRLILLTYILNKTPNCTLVELKCFEIGDLIPFSWHSKLYLSGIEIALGGAFE